MSSRGFDVDPDLPDEYGNPHGFGMVVDPIPEHEGMGGWLSIPYVVPRGGPVAMKFRRVGQGDGPKYLSHPDAGVHVYGVRNLRTASPVVGITEGEFDSIAASGAGVPSVAVPGVSAWTDHYKFMFEGFVEVLVFGDGDDPGKKFASKVASLMTNARAVHMPKDHDVNSFVLAHGAGALLQKAGLT